MKINRLNRFALLAIPLVLGLATIFVVKIVFAAPVTIDTFDGVSQLAFSNSSSPTTNAVSDANAIGGTRKLWAVRDSGSGGVQIETNADMFGLPEALSIVSGSAARGKFAAIWDGDDTDASTIFYEGLGGIDLTNNDENDGIMLRIVGEDNTPGVITIIIHTNETTFSEAAYEYIPLANFQPYTLTFPFETFIGNANFEDVGAIIVELEGIDDGFDFDIAFTRADATMDFGDLPDTYITSLDGGGPRHSLGNIYLGTAVDAEIDAHVDPDAEGDLYDDGIEVIGTDGEGRWQNGADGGAVRVTWTSPFANGHACLDGWINWDHSHSDPANHTFADSANYNADSKHVVRGHRLEDASGSPLEEDVTFDVPAGFFPGGDGDPLGLASRWRIYPVDENGNCPTGGIDYTGFMVNGEVEDYIWGFTPTAVTLAGFQIAGVAGAPWIIAVTAVLILLTGLALTIRRRQEA